MSILEYLRSRAFNIIIKILFIILVVLLLMAFSVNNYVIIDICIMYFITVIICFMHDYIKLNNFFKMLNKYMDGLDRKYLVHEFLTKGDMYVGDLFIDYLTEINKSYNDSVNEYKYSLTEFKEYLELWCHEIKTPIATERLIIENNRNSITTSILEEVNKIDNYIEQVMYYARSENVNEDYIIGKVNLKEIINNVIKRNKKDIINKKIKINMFSDDIYVYSDIKWLEYIINQIVVNSIKYIKDHENKIEFNFVNNENNVFLNIIDNGIGINEDDLPNIFKKGYTGINGRKKYNSTGMGLYLCKKLCNKLGHDIVISSHENKDTKVTIIFPISSMTK